MNPLETPEVRKVLEEVPAAALTATSNLLATCSQPLSRRWLLRGALAAPAAASLILNAQAVHAEATSAGDLTEFFSILATGEALFTTFYSHAVKNHAKLGLFGSALDAIQAIRTEEQLHTNFALAYGGKLATTHFSFPHGEETFEDRSVFLATQQLAEELTNGALLAWIIDMARMGLPRLAQIGGQLMQVEGGHRVVGRVIMEADPWDNWAFGPVVLEDFLKVPQVVTAAGFLSPRPGNDFEFHPAPSSYPGVIHTTPNN